MPDEHCHAKYPSGDDYTAQRMTRRNIERIKKAVLLAVPLSVVQFVLEWIGYGRKWNSTGEIRPLREIWWHFPLEFCVFVALTLIFLPRQNGPETGIQQDS